MRIKATLNCAAKFSNHANRDLNKNHQSSHACIDNPHQNERWRSKANSFNCHHRLCSFTTTHIGGDEQAQVIFYTGRALASRFVCGETVMHVTDFNPHPEMIHLFQENNKTSFMMSDLNRCFMMYRCIAQSYQILFASN